MINYFNEKDTLDPSIYDELELYCDDYEEYESYTFLDLDVEEESVSEKELSTLDDLWKELELITKGSKSTLVERCPDSYYSHSTNNYATTR